MISKQGFPLQAVAGSNFVVMIGSPADFFLEVAGCGFIAIFYCYYEWREVRWPFPPSREFLSPSLSLSSCEPTGTLIWTIAQNLVPG